MTSTEATPETTSEKRTRRTVDRNAFAAAMGAVSDATVKPKTTATSSFNPLFDAFNASWEGGAYETFKRNVNGSTEDVREWSGAPKSLTIETDRVDDAKQLVVDAAKRLGTGYRFRSPEEEVTYGDDGTSYSVVYFWAHEKSQRARKNSDGTDVPEGQPDEETVPA